MGNRRKPPFPTDYIPESQELERFDKLLETFPGEVRKKLQNWLKNVDFSIIRARSAYDEILRNLMLMALYSSTMPNGSDVIAGIREARQCVVAHSKIYKEFLTVDLPEEINEQIETKMRELRDAYAKSLPEGEQRDRFLEMFRDEESD